jgi:single-stranded-DNA-specific exonuclease
MELAHKLGTTNRERQMVMMNATEHASLSIKAKNTLKKMLVVADEKYPEGVIGLVAGRLVEEYYRPSIVISRGKKISKGSVRSVSGFNIIDFLRSISEYFVSVGGHPMAAGFTIETEKIALLQEKIEEIAESLVDDSILTRSLRIDCEIPFSVISKGFYDHLQQLAPFGMGNPEPIFATTGVTIEDIRYIGKENKHLKLIVSSGETKFEAVAFGMGDKMQELSEKKTVSLAYVVDENVWNGNRKLQLKIKDVKAIK